MKTTLFALLLLPIIAISMPRINHFTNIDNQPHNWSSHGGYFIAQEQTDAPNIAMQDFHCTTHGSDKDGVLMTYDVYVNKNTWSYHFANMYYFDTNDFFPLRFNSKIYYIRVVVTHSPGIPVTPSVYSKCSLDTGT